MSDRAKSPLRWEPASDVAFHRREWRVQRGGWWAMAIVVAAALCGVFGGGPASWVSRTDPTGSLTVEYERFARLGAASNVTIRVDATRTDGGDVEVLIDRTLLAGHELVMISPEPRAGSMEGKRVRLFFDAAGATGRTLSIVLRVEPLSAGVHVGRIALDEGECVTVSTWVYP